MGDRLPPRKKRAILALVEHGAVSRAADVVGVTRQTLYRWMREPLFRAELQAATGSQVAEASRRLDGLLMRAVDELERLLDSESEHQRRLAVDSILSHAARLRELVDIEERITVLEQRSKKS